MYLTTFYSFKGGVGRTLALANVATYLVRRGRRVLLVDFDLEAPGLDTFDIFKPPKGTPGIVEYVSDFLMSHESPDVRDYSYEVNLSARAVDPRSSTAGDLLASEGTRDDGQHNELAKVGRLWVMPAGKRESSYSTLLQSIDWDALYAEHNGYLMFEDLKEQWQQAFDPDYVLLDSRTGHTDVGGICTRQLPDAVVLLFFPNDQNLRGLESVVSDIRDEERTPRKKHIELHFVMSNVPDLDDEDRILSSRVTKFSKTLGFGRLSVIHHYDSLTLLNQTIFCEERPRSRLARDYLQLARSIVRRNLGDREGVLEFLREIASERRTVNLSPIEIKDRLADISVKHNTDAEIITQLAIVHMQQGAHDQARQLLESAITGTINSPEVILNRTDSRLLLLLDRQGAAVDAAEALSRPAISDRDIERAIGILRQSEADDILDGLLAMPAIRASLLDTRIHLAHELRHTFHELALSIDLFSNVLEDPVTDEEDRVHAKSELAVSLIGAGQFERAMDVLSPEVRRAKGFEIQNAFNYSMAHWAATGSPDAELFKKVVELDKESSGTSINPNYAECLSVAYWALGSSEEARNFLAKARSLIRPRSQFSCWRYLDVSAETFAQDLDAISQMIDGAKFLPEFMRDRERSTRLH